jgi:hypothetical protein
MSVTGLCAFFALPALAGDKVIGTWTQDGMSPVAAAYCNPHCKENEGSTVPVQINYPDNLEYHGQPVTLKNFKANCISDTDWCVFDHVISLTDDPAQHRMTVLFWSHSNAVNVQLTADEVVSDDHH